MGPQTKQAQKTQRTRETIIRTATRLMRRYGFENTSIRQICQEAGVSTGSFYHLFSSKGEIVDIILHEVNNCYIDPHLDYEHDSPYALADGLVANHLSVINALSPEVVFNAIFGPVNGNKTMFSEKRATTRFLVQALERFQKSGKLRPDIPVGTMEQELTECFYGTFYAVYTMEELHHLEDRLRTVLYRLFSCYMQI